MGLLERVIRALIYVAFLALCFFLIIWVLGALGLALPPRIITILEVIFILFAILVLIRLLAGPLGAGNWRLWPPDRP